MLEKIIVLRMLFLLLSLLPSACIYQIENLDEAIPITDAQFQQPPGDLRTYPAIAKVQKGYAYRGVHLNQFIEKWGSPNKSEKNYSAQWLRIGFFGGFLAALLEEDTAAGFGLGLGLGYFMQPRPPELHVWDKGNYRIEAKFERLFNWSQPSLFRWDWSYARNAQRKRLFAAQQKRFNLYGSTQGSRGNNKASSLFNLNRLKMGSDLGFIMGVEVSNVIRQTDLRLGYSIYRKSFTTDDNENELRIKGNFIELLALYKLNRSAFNIGLGTSYYLNPIIDVKTTNNTTLLKQDLDNELGMNVRLEYRYAPSIVYGIKLEILEYDLKGGGTFDGNHIAFYMVNK